MQDYLFFIKKAKKIAKKLKGFMSFLKSLEEIDENTNFEKPFLNLSLQITTSTHEEGGKEKTRILDISIMKLESPESYKALVKCLSDVCEYEINKTEIQLEGLFENWG